LEAPAAASPGLRLRAAIAAMGSGLAFDFFNLILLLLFYNHYKLFLAA
jgi:hypothetical protein